MHDETKQEVKDTEFSSPREMSMPTFEYQKTSAGTYAATFDGKAEPDDKDREILERAFQNLSL